MVDNIIEFRVTSTYWKNKLQFIYGVPVSPGTTKRITATDYIKIQANRNTLPVEPSIGQQWRVSGGCKQIQVARNHRLYNDITFEQPSLLEITLPSTDEGFIHFISREIEHVSDEKARNLWSHFGNAVYAILENKDKKTLLSVKGLGEASVNLLIEGFAKYVNLKHCNWFAKHKIPLFIQRRLIKYHSQRSVDVIKNNPYELVAFGMSFYDVDQLAQSAFDIPVDADIRLAAAVHASLTMSLPLMKV